ncbi:MAG TPA: SgcJ/EcaC family oxidoreductase [Terriglobales bacterium]|nr:SgcJ/EcaC family oxidoreductase [Terriglobales bacterium]
MTKRVMILAGVLCSIIWCPALPVLAQDHADEAAIRNIVNGEVAAWDKGDAVAYSAHFAPGGTFTNILGAFYTGHDAFAKEHDHIFKTIFRGSTLQQDIVSLQFADPDVAVVEVLTAVTGAKLPSARSDTVDKKKRLRTRLLQVMVRRGGAWEIVAYHNVEVNNAVSLPEPK